MKKFVMISVQVALALYMALCEPFTAYASSASPSPIPATATPAPTQNPAYAKMALRLGDEGGAVELLQQRLRDLQYFTYRVTGSFGSVTEESLINFQKDNGLTADGVFGGATAALLYSGAAERATLNSRIPTPTPRPTPPPSSTPRYGTIVEWSTAKNFVAWGGGSKFLCKDVRTGKEYYLKRVGGSNHMDVEPATAGDTATLLACYGGKWSWNRRPTIVRFGGKWYAASINGWAHGKETVSGNNMNGQICLHFKNSRTHGTNVVDSAHQRCINEAAGR